MTQLDVFVKPGYDTCCECIDNQVSYKSNMDCNKCKKLKQATLYEFVREKGKTYGVVKYDNGIFGTIELWMIISKEQNR